MVVEIDGVAPNVAEPAAGSAALPVVSVQNPATPVRVAAVASANVKAAAGRVIGLTINNDTAAAAYVQLIDNVGAGVLGAGIVYEVKVGIGASLTVWFGDIGIKFVNGIAVGAATAAGGAVAVAAGCVVSLQYK